jgi:hypothetical protein
VPSLRFYSTRKTGVQIHAKFLSEELAHLLDSITKAEQATRAQVARVVFVQVSRRLLLRNTEGGSARIRNCLTGEATIRAPDLELRSNAHHDKETLKSMPDPSGVDPSASRPLAGGAGGHKDTGAPKRVRSLAGSSRDKAVDIGCIVNELIAGVTN